MKNLFVVIVAILPFFCFAKNNSLSYKENNNALTLLTDSIKVKVPAKNQIDTVKASTDVRKPKRIKNRWILFDMGVNAWMNEGKLDLPNELQDWEQKHGRSLSYNLQLFRQRLSLNKAKTVNLMYGFGFEFNNYTFRNGVNLVPDIDVIELQDVTDSGSQPRRNKLNTRSLYVPLMLNFKSNTKGDKPSFKFSVGGYGGVLIGARTKIRQSRRDRTKVRDDFNLNRWQYGLRTEVGVGAFNFYADYALNTMFKDVAGQPNLNTLTIGLQIIPF